MPAPPGEAHREAPAPHRPAGGGADFRCGGGMVLTLCTVLFLRSYRAAIVEAPAPTVRRRSVRLWARWATMSIRWTAPWPLCMEQLQEDAAPRDAFLGAFLTARPEVAAITVYDADGSLLNCWAQDGRTPKADILRNLSFDLTTAQPPQRRLYQHAPRRVDFYRLLSVGGLHRPPGTGQCRSAGCRWT